MSFDNGTATYATTACTYVGTGPIATGGGNSDEMRTCRDAPGTRYHRMPSRLGELKPSIQQHDFPAPTSRRHVDQPLVVRTAELQ